MQCLLRGASLQFGERIGKRLMGKRILFAIGGNSLIEDALHVGVEDQYDAVCRTIGKICSILQEGHRAVITHGNGPQVGFILRRSEIAHEVAHMHAVPLVSCGADTQGAIGYQIQQALDNQFRKGHINHRAVTLVTQIRVEADDPAFKNPAKPIGPFYTEKETRLLKEQNPDWTLIEDSGRGWRRVVPSPAPCEIIELEALKVLFEQGFTLVAAGGGGIPVVEQKGELKGVDAVIDKDKASALLAVDMGIDTLVISTGVPHVSLYFGTPQEKPLFHTHTAEMDTYLKEGHFAPGSMAPKIEAALFFLKQGGKEVIITDPMNLADAFFEGKGTHILP